MHFLHGWQHELFLNWKGGKNNNRLVNGKDDLFELCISVL